MKLATIVFTTLWSMIFVSATLNGNSVCQQAESTKTFFSTVPQPGMSINENPAVRTIGASVKELYIPSKVSRVPEGNDFNNDSSEFSYKQMYSLTREQFNDEIFDAYRRFMTWDLPRIEKVAAPHSDRHHTTLIAAGDGWYRNSPENWPQNYGYNGIRHTVPKGGTKVKLQFKGITETDGCNAVKTDKAGWRYGLVAHLSDGTRVYGDILKDSEGKATFKVPKNTEHLWLVVSGAPTEHIGR